MLYNKIVTTEEATYNIPIRPTLLNHLIIAVDGVALNFAPHLPSLSPNIVYTGELVVRAKEGEDIENLQLLCSDDCRFVTLGSQAYLYTLNQDYIHVIRYHVLKSPNGVTPSSTIMLDITRHSLAGIS